MPLDTETKGCLIFSIRADSATVARIKSRLSSDYSPPAFAEGSWFLATNPIFLAEFSGAIGYMRRLEKTFAANGGTEVRIVPGCLSRRNLLWGAPESDRRAVYLSDNAYAMLGGVLDDNDDFQPEDSDAELALPQGLIDCALRVLGA